MHAFARFTAAAFQLTAALAGVAIFVAILRVIRAVVGGG